jgi:hypothetical protein
MRYKVSSETLNSISHVSSKVVYEIKKVNGNLLEG